jgi:hypothetical protein
VSFYFLAIDRKSKLEASTRAPRFADIFGPKTVPFFTLSGTVQLTASVGVDPVLRVHSRLHARLHQLERLLDE